jgi:hypothetical protein
VRRKKRSNRGWGGGHKFNGREKIAWKSTNKIKNVFVFCILILNTLGKMFSAN